MATDRQVDPRTGRTWKGLAALLATVSLLGVTACGGPDNEARDAGYQRRAAQQRADIYEYSNDQYFDNCRWSQGCGGRPGAWSGSDTNSLTGDDEIAPLSGWGG